MGDNQHHQDGTKNVHAGTNHVGESVNTPIFLSSTYKLTEERYAGWAAGAQHTLLYSRLSSVNSDAVAQKICAMEGGEDAETFASGMGPACRNHRMGSDVHMDETSHERVAT